MNGVDHRLVSGGASAEVSSPASPSAQTGPNLRMGRSVLFNAVGLGTPLLVAVYTIPVLIDGLGTARFGLLTLVWAVVSYFGLFDLGLGRALTRQLAVETASGRVERIGPMLGTAGVIMLALGVLGALLMAAAAPWAPRLISGVPDAGELTLAMLAMALALPAIVLTSGMRGVLEAEHAFGLVNLIRVPMGLFTFVGPVVVLWSIGPRLDWIAAVLAAGRVLACLTHWLAITRVYRGRMPRLALQREFVRPLLSSGGWLTVSNLISPLMGYADRFVIAALITASAVAWYATPHELVSKLWIVPGALTAVLFPAFAAQSVADVAQTPRLFGRATAALFALLLPLTAGLALFANELLALWIDAAFAAQSAVLLQIFAFGTLVNALAHVPFTLLQGVGAARTTATIHAIELPLFLLALVWMTQAYGLMGAAAAWLLRICADTTLMFECCRRQQGWSWTTSVRRHCGLLAVASGLAFAGIALSSATARAAWLLGIVALATAALAHEFRQTRTAEAAH